MNEKWRYPLKAKVKDSEAHPNLQVGVAAKKCNREPLPLK